MAAFHIDKPRKVIPLWKTFKESLKSGELMGIGGPMPTLNREHFDSALEAWQSSKTLALAVEVVNAAYAMGLEEEAKGAAKQVLKTLPKKDALLLGIAEKVLSKHRDLVTTSHRALKVPTIRERLRRLKQQISLFPESPFPWVDLARGYITLGQSAKARHAILVALALANGNRFVVRAAVRFFVHQDEFDTAHDIIRRVSNVTDPWIVAAEIAASAAAGRTSRHIKAAKRWIENEVFSPFDGSELASALGTLELESGNAKRSRKLILRSLEAPTENSLAQAVWAAPSLASIDFEAIQDGLEWPESGEAAALANRHNEKWDKAVSAAQDWQEEQPFSSRPALFGSYLAGIAMNQHELAEEFARVGLRANPGNFMLRNNLVFSLAKQNKGEDALIEFNKIHRPTADETDTLGVWHATRGLVYFRLGNVDEGRASYMRALDVLRDDERKILGSLYWAMEEVELKSNARKDVVERAIESGKRGKKPEIKIQVDRLNRLREKS
jgi:tetratricopeptide (TPR) repeat protein